MTSSEDYSKLKVADLQKELKSRGLDAKGKKDELIARLAEDDGKKEKPNSTDSIEPLTTNNNNNAPNTTINTNETKPQIQIEKLKDHEITEIIADGKPTEEHEIENDTEKNENNKDEQTESHTPPHSPPPLNTSTNDHKETTHTIDNLTEEERRKLRADRFGIPVVTKSLSTKSLTNEEQRKLARAQKFGLPVKIGPADSSLKDPAKLNSRKQRFASKIELEEEEKLKKRKERFASAQEVEEEEKKKKRSERFAATAVTK